MGKTHLELPNRKIEAGPRLGGHRPCLMPKERFYKRLRMGTLSQRVRAGANATTGGFVTR